MDAAIRVRDVRSLRGPAWLAGGWRLFRGAPMVWMGLGAGWMLITLGLVLVPVVGGVAANLLQPVFFASFALAARKHSPRGPEMGDLFWASAAAAPPRQPGAICSSPKSRSSSSCPCWGSRGGRGRRIVTVTDYVRLLQGKE